MSWLAPITDILLAVTMIILLVRVSTLSWELNRVWHMQRLQYERLLEEITSGLATLRLDLQLPPVSGYCGICLQWTGGDPRKHADYCRFSHVSAVRDWKMTHPGEPLPEGAEDPDEQQEQGSGTVPGSTPQ